MTNHSENKTKTESAPPMRWFSVDLGFAWDSGADLDTVKAALGVREGWVVNIEYWSPDGLDRIIEDVVFTDFEVDSDSPEYAVILVGNRYDEVLDVNNGSNVRGAPVRIPLAGARITLY